MTNDNVPLSDSEDNRPRVAFYGVSKVGPECAVLQGGRRGYIMRGLQRSVGFTGGNRVIRFSKFLEEIAPNALVHMGKSGYPIEVVMPHGGIGKWVEAGILTKIVRGVIAAAIDGRLGKHRAHLVAPCMTLLGALGETGEAALIDEATGYQFHRESDALQDLFARLLRDEPDDWKQRFHGGYYKALCRLFRFKYEYHRPLPSVVGQITERWVYGVLFPREVIDEMRARRDGRSLHDKLHQWLADGPGVKALDSQINEITTIAATSADYRDFEARCVRRWPQAGQQLSMIYPCRPAA